MPGENGEAAFGAEISATKHFCMRHFLITDFHNCGAQFLDSSRGKARFFLALTMDKIAGIK